MKNASLALAAADDDELACSLLTANTAAFARTGERPYSCQVDGCGYFNERRSHDAHACLHGRASARLYCGWVWV